MWYHYEMSQSDKKPRRATKRSAANDRKSRSVNGNSDAFKIELADFERISAVEGLHLSAEMKKMFREFDRKNLSAEARRKRLIARYGKQPISG
jgi:hypothetical protein